ncbi:MAG TPA: type I-D CRISPR-associated protein Cas7/Csc2 [Chitinophagales bacterium]|nr:type I-D CRISPR-associated protein Cas7/Csc2 [Chitinophagales bacterium]
MKELFDLIPEKFFVKDLKQNQLGHIKLAFLRHTTGNLIIRSNYADETITFKIDDHRDVVEIPARKLKSKEKLLGLRICREFKVVDESVRYNVIKDSKFLANPNSILFGDSVTESGDSIALSSRVMYDWAYSIRDVSQITDTLQHNALSEGGTMFNEEEGKLRQSLFQTQYIKPGVCFPHFITAENVSPELFLHLLFCTLEQNRYGAQSTTTGANIQNILVGVGFGNFESPINSYTISKNWGSQEVNAQTVSHAITQAMQNAYGNQFLPGDAFTKLAANLWTDTDRLKQIYTTAKNSCIDYLTKIKIMGKK